MQISTQTSFAADPQTTYGLLTNREFLEEVCVAGHSITYAVAVNADTDVTTTRTTQELPAPELATKFVGKTITVDQSIAWGAAAADGSRVGQVTMTVPRQPVQLNATLTLRPVGDGTTADLVGELKVSIPLVGRKLEQAAEPAVLAGFYKQEQVGRQWLSR